MRGSAPSLAAIFRQFVERVDTYQEYVVVEIYELDHLLHAPVDLGADKAAEFAHAMVDVDYVVAYLNLAEFLEREGHLA